MAAIHRYAQYGVQWDVYFSLQAPAATSGDRDVTTAAGSLFAASGDVKISKDGGALANTTNNPTQVTASQGLYKLVLTATEMQATQIIVRVVDQDGPAWRDLQIVLETKLRVGQLDVDPTQIGGNTPGIVTKGVGNEAGLKATGGSSGDGIKGIGGSASGAGINGAASAGNSDGITGAGFGTGAGLKGTGGATGQGIRGVGGSGSGAGISGAATAGTSHGIEGTGVNAGDGIKAVSGTTGHGIEAIGGATSGDGFRATAQGSGDGFHGVGAGTGSAANFGGSAASFSWDDLEGIEPSGAPAANSSFRQIMQYLKRAALNYATESSGVRKVYKDDSASELFRQQIGTDGVTRTRGRAQ